MTFTQTPITSCFLSPWDKKKEAAMYPSFTVIFPPTKQLNRQMTKGTGDQTSKRRNTAVRQVNQAQFCRNDHHTVPIWNVFQPSPPASAVLSANKGYASSKPISSNCFGKLCPLGCDTMGGIATLMVAGRSAGLRFSCFRREKAPTRGSRVINMVHRRRYPPQNPGHRNPDEPRRQTPT